MFSSVVTWVLLVILLMKPTGEKGRGTEFAAMPVHQMLFFITTVHFNKILGTFDKTVFKEQSC